MPIDRAFYRKGMWMHGGAFAADGTALGRPQPDPDERKPTTLAIDPRLIFLQKHTATLTEIGAKLDALKPQIDALAAKVRAMILVGYATTTDAAVDGYIFAPGAIDCRQESVPLFHRHQRQIGQVLTMQYRGDRLLVTVETDDPVALKTDFMSPAAQVLALDGKRVTKARLTEISLTGTPANPHCRVLERRQHDPLRALWLNRLKWHDHITQWCGLLQKYVELLPAVDAALAAAAPQQRLPDTSVKKTMTPAGSNPTGGDP